MVSHQIHIFASEHVFFFRMNLAGRISTKVIALLRRSAVMGSRCLVLFGEYFFLLFYEPPDSLPIRLFIRFWFGFGPYVIYLLQLYLSQQLKLMIRRSSRCSLYYPMTGSCGLIATANISTVETFLHHEREAELTRKMGWMVFYRRFILANAA